MAKFKTFRESITEGEECIKKLDDAVNNFIESEVDKVIYSKFYSDGKYNYYTLYYTAHFYNKL